MTTERDELAKLIAQAGIKGPSTVECLRLKDAEHYADAILAAGYRKRAKHVHECPPSGGGITITGDTTLQPDRVLGMRIAKLEHGFPEPEWGVKWGDEIRAVPDKARAKFIANVMGVDFYGRMPLGKWVKVARDG